MDRYFRVFRFAGQVFAMAARKPMLLAPMMANIAFAAPLNLGLAVALGLVESEGASYALLAFGISSLYFIDYFANGLTASLIYDEVTTGRADLGAALSRTRKVVGGIALFAAISAMFDLLQAYASERNDLFSKIATRILYMIWTTATYVVMPAMVIESTSFGRAFSRSKELAENDPTQVGVGVIGIGAVNYALGAAVFTAAFKVWGALAVSHPILGAVFFYTLVNLYWAVSGYLKITYFTCFYLWAKDCERHQSTSPELAPAPLAAVLA